MLPRILLMVGAVLVSFAIICGLWLIQFTFGHPDMTEMRMFLETWQVRFCAVVLFCLGAGTIKRAFDMGAE